MSTVSPVQTTEVRAAIARAATRTGVDFDYLLAQAKLESGLDPNAKARTSSATGLYQFIDSTWLRTLDRHADKHGMDWAGDAINANGSVSAPGMRGELLSLRYDADVSSLMAAELTRDNADGLRSSLGREPEPAELYLAHFLGLGGARKFLGALSNDPGQSAVALMPKAANANRAIFYSGGQPRSVGEVMNVMQGKVAAAYGDNTPMPGIGIAAEHRFAAASVPSPYSAPRGFRSSTSAPLPAAEPRARPSMADTLRSTFGDNMTATNRANEHVAAAYSKFKAFGL